MTATGARLIRPATSDAPQRVLLLSGLAGNDAVWEPFTDELPGGAEVWMAELPWSSFSDPAWSHRGDPAEWIGRSLVAMPGTVDVVVAHSFAVPLTLEWLARNADRPRSAMVLAPFHRPTPGDFTWDTASTYLNGFHRILEEGLRVRSAGRLGDDVVAGMARRVRDRIGPYGWTRFFDAYLRTPFLDVAALDLPVRIVAGADDFCAPPGDAAALAARLPDARLEILTGCGHFPMAERPGHCAGVAGDLLRELVRLTTTSRS
ncbi:pimeloyl-ACP methyl ester carboxylesterase [Micromonospora sp. A202]|uniref:alpha/beta fold hydrolase n=1 Tax=Micromonospora sp. A202 TaxID=2572899 RepID=UPI00116F425B|nr:alpha/beta hydrolase [Micromonospora sp. A202]TQJ23669.1 pimeloyl-ACP methyl ester carboxylesterase [Micromonospora sp. A202]